jgi:hypothetical protein
MNIPGWLFGTTSLLLGGICLYLSTQVRGECAQARVAAQPDDEFREELAQLRAERDRLETEVHSMRAGPVTVTPEPQPRAAGSALLSAPPVRATFQPELSTKNRRFLVRLRNGRIFRDLGLSDAEAEALLDLLVAQEERAREQNPGFMLGSPDQELRARNRAQVEALIGRERAERLDSWQSQTLARMELRRVRDELDDLGEPLTFDLGRGARTMRPSAAY